MPSDSAQAAMGEWVSGDPPNPSELPSGGSYHGASSLLGTSTSRSLRPRVHPSSTTSTSNSSLPDPVKQRCPVCYKQMFERSIKQHVTQTCSSLYICNKQLTLTRCQLYCCFDSPENYV